MGPLKGRRCIYTSDEDVGAAATLATRLCFLGNTLGLAGVMAVVSALEPAAFVGSQAFWLATLSASWSYLVLFRTPQRLQELAAAHVERIAVLLPEGVKASTGSGDAQQELKDNAAFAGVAARLLDAIPEVHIEVTCASVVRHLHLVKAMSTGNVRLAKMDPRPRFFDLCERPSWDGGPERSIRRGPLHIALDSGHATDRLLLDALLRSHKVLADEEVELRSGLCSTLTLPESADHGNLQLTAMTRGSEFAPILAVQRYTRATLLRGCLILAAGCGLAWRWQSEEDDAQDDAPTSWTHYSGVHPEVASRIA